MSWIGKIRRVGRIVEPAQDAPEATVDPAHRGDRLASAAARGLRFLQWL